MSRQNQRMRWVLGVFTVCILAAFGLIGQQAAAQNLDDLAAGQAMLAQINGWRLGLGLAPLKPNETLHAMAVDQASYLVSLTDIPSGNEMHIGRNGETLRERAARYGWPSYGEGGLSAVSEIAWVGQDDGAMTFWQGSSIHTEVVTNPGFREIGIAAVPHPWGHAFIVVMGSRMDVLPALADATGTSLYLTQDVFKYGLGNIPPTKIYLFDADGKALNNGLAQDWAPMIAIPPETGSKIYVLYNDGNGQSLAEVDLTVDRVSSH